MGRRLITSGYASRTTLMVSGERIDSPAPNCCSNTVWSGKQLAMARDNSLGVNHSLTLSVANSFTEIFIPTGSLLAITREHVYPDWLGGVRSTNPSTDAAVPALRPDDSLIPGKHHDVMFERFSFSITLANRSRTRWKVPRHYCFQCRWISECKTLDDRVRCLMKDCLMECQPICEMIFLSNNLNTIRSDATKHTSKF